MDKYSPNFCNRYTYNVHMFPSFCFFSSRIFHINIHKHSIQHVYQDFAYTLRFWGNADMAMALLFVCNIFDDWLYDSCICVSLLYRLLGTFKRRINTYKEAGHSLSLLKFFLVPIAYWALPLNDQIKLVEECINNVFK